ADHDAPRPEGGAERALDVEVSVALDLHLAERTGRLALRTEIRDVDGHVDPGRADGGDLEAPALDPDRRRDTRGGAVTQDADVAPHDRERLRGRHRRLEGGARAVEVERDPRRSAAQEAEGLRRVRAQDGRRLVAPRIEGDAAREAQYVGGAHVERSEHLDD